MHYFRITLEKIPKYDIIEVFAENLKRLRNERGHSLRSLAEAAGVHNADISRMENGKINITLMSLDTLAEALGVETYEFLIARPKPKK